MPVISEVRGDPRDPACTTVRVSDGRAFRVDAGAVSDLDLRAGVRLDPELESRLTREEDGSRARARALRFLETRERSHSEVQQRLRRYGYEEPLVGEVLEWLSGLGYLDERRFAEWFARARSREAWGPRRLREELRRKGVARAVIEETVSSYAPADQGDETLIEELAARTAGRFARDLRTDRESAHRRISGYLGRRGHDWDVIRAVLARLDDTDAALDADDT